MEYLVENELKLPNILVQLMTVTWGGIEETPPYEGYCLSQRLSENHSPLRIGNVAAKEVLPRARSVGFLPPGCPIRLFPMEKPLRVIYCMFDKNYFEHATGITENEWNEQLGVLMSLKNKRLEILMQEIYAELLQPDFGSERVIAAVGEMLLVELTRYAQKLQRKKSNPGNILALAPWQLRRIQTRIESSLELGYPNLSELAELCGISHGHLMRTFKASTGWQIQKYIAEERMKAAKSMLSDVDMSCEDVAQKLGFKSAAYFSTVFRRMTGKTPSEYRSDLRAHT